MHTGEMALGDFFSDTQVSKDPTGLGALQSTRYKVSSIKTQIILQDLLHIGYGSVSGCTFAFTSPYSVLRGDAKYV